MEPDAIDRILKSSENVFYTDFFLLFIQLITIAVILFFLRKEKMGYPFLIYCCASFLAILAGRVSYFFYSKKESSAIFIEGANIVFAIIEYSVFYHFFKKMISSSIVKKVMFYFFALIFVAFIIFLYNLFFVLLTDIIIYKISDYIISSELLFLSFLCVVYYFELFRKKPIGNLLQSPSFWIVTSLFFYCIIIIPFFMIITDEFMNKHKEVFSSFFAVHFISFSLLFIAITRAFLCKKPLTT